MTARERRALNTRELSCAGSTRASIVLHEAKEMDCRDTSGGNDA
ncbi:hypothetical protein [Afipia sp. Root123D2]|nr:hypothetical protein [Afipia sp. Root123D2]